MSQSRYGSTIDTGNDHIVAVGSNRTNVNIELGQARDVGRTTYVRSSYAARYNFAVQLYNSYETDSTKDKRNMRGGHFFLYNFVVLVLFSGSVVCINNISDNKSLGAMPIVTSVIYLLITCYNWHIRRTNGSLIHEHMIRIQDRHLSNSVNEHFKIPVHARIENRQLIAASDGSTTAILARLQQQNLDLDEISIMLYGSKYINKYIRFPNESVIHFILFLITLIVAGSQMSNN